MENMREKAEVLKIIHYHFREDEGLLNTIEKTGIIDPLQVESIKQALYNLSILDKERSSIDKSDVKDLVLVISRLEACYWHYPESNKAIQELIEDMQKWIGDLFISSTPPASYITEDYARASIIHNLIGLPPSFVLELRMKGIDRSSAEELIESIDFLSEYWKGENDLDKSDVATLLSAQSITWRFKKFYDIDELKVIRSIQSEILQHVTLCFQSSKDE